MPPPENKSHKSIKVNKKTTISQKNKWTTTFTSLSNHFNDKTRSKKQGTLGVLTYIKIIIIVN
jgi:hypothetical protein